MGDPSRAVGALPIVVFPRLPRSDNFQVTAVLLYNPTLLRRPRRDRKVIIRCLTVAVLIIALYVGHVCLLVNATSKFLERILQVNDREDGRTTAALHPRTCI